MSTTQPTTAKTAKTATGLNLRTSPEMGAMVIRTLLKGETVTLREGTAQCDDIAWARVTSWKNERGWVASKYLVMTDIPSPIPTAKKPIGIHVAGSGDIGDLLGVAERLYKNGTPIPAVMIISDPGLCKAVKDVSPATDVYYRWVASASDPGPFDGMDENGNGSIVSGRMWFDHMWARHSQATKADYHQMYNECSFGGNGQNATYAVRVNEFEQQLMTRANELGVKVTIGNYMPGVPEALHIERLRPAFAMAEQHGHALCYHAYTSVTRDASFIADAPYFALRWVEWVKQFPKLKIILGETGHYNSPRFRGVPDMLNGMTELSNLLMPLMDSGRDVRACWWTIRGQNDMLWKVDDWTPYLTDYEQWMKG